MRGESKDQGWGLLMGAGSPGMEKALNPLTPRPGLQPWRLSHNAKEEIFVGTGPGLALPVGLEAAERDGRPEREAQSHLQAVLAGGHLVIRLVAMAPAVLRSSADTFMNLTTGLG